jgi:hypothetical protein
LYCGGYKNNGNAKKIAEKQAPVEDNQALLSVYLLFYQKAIYSWHANQAIKMTVTWG